MNWTRDSLAVLGVLHLCGPDRRHTLSIREIAEIVLERTDSVALGRVRRGLDTIRDAGWLYREIISPAKRGERRRFGLAVRHQHSISRFISRRRLPDLPLSP